MLQRDGASVEKFYNPGAMFALSCQANLAWTPAWEMLDEIFCHVCVCPNINRPSLFMISSCPIDVSLQAFKAPSHDSHLNNYMLGTWKSVRGVELVKNPCVGVELGYELTFSVFCCIAGRGEAVLTFPAGFSYRALLHVRFPSKGRCEGPYIRFMTS